VGDGVGPWRVMLDGVTRWRLARWIAGADPAELEEIANPHGRLLVLTLRATVALAKQRGQGQAPPRHESLAEVLRYLYEPEQAAQVQDAIVAVAPTERPPTESRNRHIDDILDDPAIEQEMIVPNRLPVGLTVLAGRPKVGKSWLLLDAAASIAQGLPVLGVAVVRPGPVNYWALEDNWDRIKARGRRQGVRRGIPLVVRTQPARLPECVEEFAEDLELYRPRAFFIDTLSRIIPPGASLNDSGEMTHALDLMQRLAFQFNCALVLVHHQRKNNEAADHLDSVMGATGITGAADAILSLSRARGEDTASLAITGRDIEEELRLTLRWDRARCRWETLVVAEAQPPASLSAQVLRAVGERGRADVATVAAAIGRDRTTAQTELKRLRDRGELIVADGRHGRKVYARPDAGLALGDAEAEEE
jgi:hypothetical protein